MSPEDRVKNYRALRRELRDIQHRIRTLAEEQLEENREQDALLFAASLLTEPLGQLERAQALARP